MSGFRLSDAERGLFFSRLAGVFGAGELNFSGSQPLPGSFLDQLPRPEFWLVFAGETNPVADTPAINFYLAYCFGEDYADTLKNCFAVCARSFYDTRHDHSGARDLLLFFLHQNVDFLRHLFILNQSANRALAASAEALQECFGAPEIARLMLEPAFADWALQQWLPFQLRQHHADEDRAQTDHVIQRAGASIQNE